MAIELKQPLTQRLFAIGTTTGSDDQPNFQYQGRRPSGFNAPMPSPPPMEEEEEGGQFGALAQTAVMLGSQYANRSSAVMPVDSNGNGFGLGGNLAGGDVLNPTYAGDSKPGLLQTMGYKRKEDEGIQQPLTLGSATIGGRPSLFNY